MHSPFVALKLCNLLLRGMTAIFLIKYFILIIEFHSFLRKISLKLIGN